MSQNSYDQRRQKIENEAAESLLGLRGERHFSVEDLEDARKKISLPSFLFGLSTGIVITMILCFILKMHP
jgi:hypothetical protein